MHILSTFVMSIFVPRCQKYLLMIIVLTSYDDHHGLSVSTLQSNMDTYGMLTESQMDILFSITQAYISQNEKTNIDNIFMGLPKFKHFSLDIQSIYFNVSRGLWILNKISLCPSWKLQYWSGTLQCLLGPKQYLFNDHG